MAAQGTLDGPIVGTACLLQDAIIGGTRFNQERIDRQTTTGLEGLTLGDTIVPSGFHHDGNDIVVEMMHDALVHLGQDLIGIGNVIPVVYVIAWQDDAWRDAC